MKVEVIHCGPFANESEQRAVIELKTRLISTLGDDQWLLLTNLAFSSTHRRQSDEIDIVAIGPPGVRVIEVKHWTTTWINGNFDRVEHEADRLTDKARKVGTTLRRKIAAIGRVDGVILVTQEAEKVKSVSGSVVRGVVFHTIQDWQTALCFHAPHVLSTPQIKLVGEALWPKASVSLDGVLKPLAGYTSLSLQSPVDHRFHRVYKGTHSARRNAVVLHLYDTSATDQPNAEARARREFEALQRLQLHAWAPRIEDSFQEAPGYSGEMWFFAVTDPAAPSVEERAEDCTWNTTARVAFARDAVRALALLHQSGQGGKAMLHRNLDPSTILVRHDNTPILTSFQHARIPASLTVAVSGVASAEDSAAVAPEIRDQGIGAADHRSDVFSICTSLSVLFVGRTDDDSRNASQILGLGSALDPAARSSLTELQGALSELLGESPPRPPAPPARFWTEDQVVSFRNRDYRIVSRLGSGGVGTTFKVVAIDGVTGGDLGAYVAKVVNDEETGNRVLGAYNLGRSHLRHSALSIIFETAEEWRDNDFVALMTWIAGEPLSEYAGVLAIHAEDCGEESGESLVIRWLLTLSDALDMLHRNGLVHGDVSPHNLIVSGSDIVLTDYDCVTRIGRRRTAPGTVIYSSHSHLKDRPAGPGDDFFALAASFFQVLFEHEPFSYDDSLVKDRGLNWSGVVEREEYRNVAAFLDQATNPDPAMRFASAAEAKAMLEAARSIYDKGVDSLEKHVDRDQPQDSPRTENTVPRLRYLLQSYPGSQWGNSETRGLDTEFAADTYVETPLEESLLTQVRERQVRLVILCGNAGDGKTALLQHLAQRLGLGNHKSEMRVREGRIRDGPFVRMNLDGSASWRGQSADDLLVEFLAPFRDGPPSNDIVHLLAINDGRLLEWIETCKERTGEETALAKDLVRLLDDDATVPPPSHIRFVNLNQRSLVGGVAADGQSIETRFLDSLVNGLYGGHQAADAWKPCSTCSAEDRCEIRKAMRLFGPPELAGPATPEQRTHARHRLFEALQAVHLRGETHITVRELRASVAYILFGIHYCSEYHKPSAQPHHPQPYWERAFAPDSSARQGDLLRELIRFDPALDAHPKVDRFLSRLAQDDTPTLGSARRRAYFEMTEETLEVETGNRNALGLARGQHLREFRDLPIVGNHHEVCRRLCAGISRLEDLPPQALDRGGVVPLRIMPRTPTETAFWVEKDLADFRVEVALPHVADGVDRLHREASLVYHYRNGGEERLRLAADLFHVLLELGDGYQLGDVSSDDTFAQLAIFVQRLVREDERRLLAWNPMQGDMIYEIATGIVDGETPDALQEISLRPLEHTNG